jgi:UDP-glucose 4-epimerase
VKIVVTGGAGFIGSNLVKNLIAQKYKVVVIDNFSTGSRINLENCDLEVIEEDFSNKKVLKDTLESNDVLIHLAAQGSVARSLTNPLKMFEENLYKSIDLLEECRDVNCKFIFASSSSVYGSSSSVNNNEDTSTNPISPYGASKLSFEKIVWSYFNSFGMNTSIFRFFNVYGPHQNPYGEFAAVIPRFIKQALAGEEIKVYGDGNQLRDYTFVEDVVNVISKSISLQMNNPVPVNLAWGNKISVNSIIKSIRDNLKVDLDVQYYPTRRGDIKESSNSSIHLRSLFPNIKQTDFQAGLSKTIDWIKLFYNIKNA